MVVFFFLEKQIIFQNKNFNTFFKDRGLSKIDSWLWFFWKKNVCFLVLPNTVQVMGHPRRCCCFFFRFLPAKTTAKTTTRCPMPSCSSGRSGTQQPIISSIDSSSSAIVVINISIIKSQKSFYFLLKNCENIHIVDEFFSVKIHKFQISSTSTTVSTKLTTLV